MHSTHSARLNRLPSPPPHTLHHYPRPQHHHPHYHHPNPQHLHPASASSSSRRHHHLPPNHPHNYHPYTRPRSANEPHVPRSLPPHRPPIKRHNSHTLPPISVVTSSSLTDAPPPLHRPHSHTRHPSHAGHYQYTPTHKSREPSPPPRHRPYGPRTPPPFLPTRTRSSSRPDLVRDYFYHGRLSDDDDFPVTPRSIKSRSMTPIDPRDALDRLPMLNISEAEDIKPQLSPLRGALSPAERRFFQTMSIPQRPVTAYPLDTSAAYTWPAQAAADPNAAAATAGGEQKRDGLAIDPALSAVRSSNDAAAGSTDVTMASAPEIRLQPETLGSVPASPAIDSNAEAAAAVAAVQALQAPDGIKKETPFSRSPELRISHKLAERKRRKEMRDLFDELREQLPADRGMKASKWEILSKAVDYIQHLKNQVADSHRLLEVATRDLAIARGQTPETATTTNTTWPSTYHTFNIPYVPHASTSTTPAPAAPAPAPVAPAPQPQAQPQAAVPTATQPTQPQAPAPSQPQPQAQAAAPAAPAPAPAAPAPAPAAPAVQPQAQAPAPQPVAAAAQPAAAAPQPQAQAPKSS